MIQKEAEALGSSRRQRGPAAGTEMRLGYAACCRPKGLMMQVAVGVTAMVVWMDLDGLHVTRGAPLSPFPCNYRPDLPQRGKPLVPGRSCFRRT